MKHELLKSAQLNGGRWCFEEVSENHWRWIVKFEEGKIICPSTYATCLDAVKNARDHGYGNENCESDAQGKSDLEIFFSEPTVRL